MSPLLVVGGPTWIGPLRALWIFRVVSFFTTTNGSFVTRSNKHHHLGSAAKAFFSAPDTRISPKIEIKDEIGSGSYGTVHKLEISGKSYIGKRAWNRFDLASLYDDKGTEYQNEKATCCRTYFEVEAHCLTRLPQHASFPIFRGVHSSSDGYKWMVFECAKGDGGSMARTLEYWLDQEQRNRRLEPGHHHLTSVAGALGLGESASLTDVLDIIIEDTLETLTVMHGKNIVHRDIKPSNMLVTPQRHRTGNDGSCSRSHLILIDFGSAADLDTAGLMKRNIGISERVAVSPIYTAPEVFIDVGRPEDALRFDCFSAALIFCQLLFQFCDERVDAGFRQQLTSADYDLNTWLQTTLQAKVAPVGLDDALQVLQERRGLWSLLKQMLQKDPIARITSSEALRRFRHLQKQEIEDPNADGPYLREVVEALELCAIESESPPTSKALQFLATFRRDRPLGLILSEAHDVELENDLDENDGRKWKIATAEALPGEVFVKGIVTDGQAEAIGIFEVGDRVQGVGELPLGQAGFERAISMLEDQPKSSKYVTLHFDRRFVNPNMSAPAETSLKAFTCIDDQGAWSSRGRRTAQEDAFLLHQVYNARTHSIVLAGVMDGHLGIAASAFVRDTFPELFAAELANRPTSSVKVLLDRSWNQIGDAYRRKCLPESCSAAYDSREGILMANTGSADYVAGTTATVVAFDSRTSQITILNCGDSRALIVQADGDVNFQTLDHSPGAELERFRTALEQGLNYSQPFCVLSRWVIPVGDYNYAVSRSLEGSFATSKGIIDRPDVSCLDAERGMVIIAATDGLWEVMDSQEVSRVVRRLRYQQLMCASDAAKCLCGLALEKGSSDNVSVVVLYLKE